MKESDEKLLQVGYKVMKLPVFIFSINFPVIPFQVFLPEAVQRENNKMYEEVKIPHSEPMPIGIEEKIVYIKDLDEVSKPFQRY